MYIGGVQRMVILLFLIPRTWPNGIDMIEDDLYVNYRGNGKITKFSSDIVKI